jgi:hypothetical protein
VTAVSATPQQSLILFALFHIEPSRCNQLATRCTIKLIILPVDSGCYLIRVDVIVYVGVNTIVALSAMPEWMNVKQRVAAYIMVFEEHITSELRFATNVRFREA